MKLGETDPRRQSVCGQLFSEATLENSRFTPPLFVFTCPPRFIPHQSLLHDPNQLDIKSKLISKILFEIWYSHLPITQHLSTIGIKTFGVSTNPQSNKTLLHRPQTCHPILPSPNPAIHNPTLLLSSSLVASHPQTPTTATKSHSKFVLIHVSSSTVVATATTALTPIISHLSSSVFPRRNVTEPSYSAKWKVANMIPTTSIVEKRVSIAWAKKR